MELNDKRPDILKAGSLAMMALFSAAQVANAECTVVYDDGTSYTDESITSCSDLYPAKTHPCADQTVERPAACSTQDMFKVINPNADENTINNVKKGLWSVVLTSPADIDPITHDKDSCLFGIEPGRMSPNSIRSIAAAREAGFRSVEIDTHLLWDAYYYPALGPDAWADESSITMIGHSEDYWAFTTYSGSHTPNANQPGALGHVWNTSPEELGEIISFGELPLFLLDIDLEVVGRTALDEWISANQVHDYIQAEVGYQDILIVFDPKYPREPRPSVVYQENTSTGAWSANWVGATVPGVGKSGCNGTTECDDSQMIKQFNDIIWGVGLDDDYRAQTALKTTLPFSSISENVVDWEYFSWVPVTPNFENVEYAEEYLEYIDDWVAGAGQSVLFIDTNITGPDWWQGHSFSWDGETFDRDGDQWKDVTHYINVKYGLRAQWWQPVAQQNIGSIGKYSVEATLIPNQSPDYTVDPSQDASILIGDLAAHLVEYGSKTAVVTQDRPDIYLQIRNRGKGATGYGCATTHSSQSDEFEDREPPMKGREPRH